MSNKIEKFEKTDLDGVITEYVNVYYDETSYNSMTKAQYDELEAAKEVKP
jgi:hypothetical protein